MQILVDQSISGRDFLRQFPVISKSRFLGEKMRHVWVMERFLGEAIVLKKKQNNNPIRGSITIGAAKSTVLGDFLEILLDPMRASVGPSSPSSARRPADCGNPSSTRPPTNPVLQATGTDGLDLRLARASDVRCGIRDNG